MGYRSGFLSTVHDGLPVSQMAKLTGFAAARMVVDRSGRVVGRIDLICEMMKTLCAKQSP
jgi:hypothetical protein